MGPLCCQGITASRWCWPGRLFHGDGLGALVDDVLELFVSLGNVEEVVAVGSRHNSKLARLVDRGVRSGYGVGRAPRAAILDDAADLVASIDEVEVDLAVDIRNRKLGVWLGVV